MKIQPIPERSDLSSLIAGYSFMEVSSLEEFSSSGVTLPDGFIELFFSRLDPISIKMNSQTQASHFSAGFVLGQTTKKIELRPLGQVDLISLKIQPWATSLFLKDKADLFSEKSFSIDDLGDSDLIQLQNKILHAQTKKEAIEHLKNYTIQSINSKKPLSELMYNAVNYIYKNKDNFKVKRLTERFNVSRQYLERQFLKHLGISPKQFARVIRIRSLTEFQKSNPRISLTEIAHKFGYFDQAHFIKDFQLVANTSPNKFFKSKNMVASNYHI